MITDKPKAFPDVLDQLITLCNCTHSSWIQGSYISIYSLHTSDKCTDLLNLGTIHKLITSQMNLIGDMMRSKWECKEAEDFAFCTNSENCHMQIFAVFAIKSCSPTLTKAIHHQIGHNICPCFYHASSTTS